MQQSPTFLNRMERILHARVEQKQEDDRPWLLRLRQGLTSVLGAVAVFFVLKGAAMAAGGALISPPAAEAGFGATLRHWLLGPDPLSSALALAMQGGTTQL